MSTSGRFERGKARQAHFRAPCAHEAAIGHRDRSAIPYPG
jgi:hypothetical protein